VFEGTFTSLFLLLSLNIIGLYPRAFTSLCSSRTLVKNLRLFKANIDIYTNPHPDSRIRTSDQWIRIRFRTLLFLSETFKMPTQPFSKVYLDHSSQMKGHNSRNQGFSFFFPKPKSGSGRPKNLWIRNPASTIQDPVLRIRDAYPGSDFFTPRIRIFPSRIRIKEFKYFNPKK
jgi:hypothetical protein